MDGVTKVLSNYIREKGISISVIAERTGFTYNALYPSLCANPTRRLRADELLGICDFLGVNPRIFYTAPNRAG